MDLFDVCRGQLRDEKNLEEFRQFCQSCNNCNMIEEIYDVVRQYCTLYKKFETIVKTYFNRKIGWALPSQVACEIVITTFNEHLTKYSNAKLVDLGAGSGVFSYIFSKSIDADRIIALDLKEPTYSSNWQRQFYKTVCNYEIQPEDLLFIAWGCHELREVLKSYAVNGTCVIILGETYGGCTLEADYFANSTWTVVEHSVPAAASFYSETLSVNRGSEAPPNPPQNPRSGFCSNGI